MTRFEFVNKLNGRLYLLSEDERRDIIDEYMEHIDLKMQEGKSEAEAIRDFGDIDELADEILQAYHIDSSKVGERTLDIYIRQRVDYIGRAAEKFLSFSARQIARLFAEFLVLMLLLSLMRWPIISCANIFSYMFAWMPDIIYNSLRTIIYFIANIINLALAFVLIYHFINKRIMDNNPTPPTPPHSGSSQGFSGDASIGSQVEKFSNMAVDKAEKFGRSALNAGEKTGSFIINFAVAIIKISLVLTVGLPGAIITICAIVGTVLAWVLYIGSGIGFLGLCICGVGVCIMAIAFMSWLCGLLGGKTNA